jgi:hypothetical protein
MLGVATVVMALAIMQKREPSEDRRVDIERCGQGAPVVPNTCPVRQPMNALVEIQPKLRSHDRKGFTNDDGVLRTQNP